MRRPAPWPFWLKGPASPFPSLAFFCVLSSTTHFQHLQGDSAAPCGPGLHGAAPWRGRPFWAAPAATGLQGRLPARARFHFPPRASGTSRLSRPLDRPPAAYLKGPLPTVRVGGGALDRPPAARPKKGPLPMVRVGGATQTSLTGSRFGAAVRLRLPKSLLAPGRSGEVAS